MEFEQNKTIAYYDQHASEFAKSTVDVDFKEMQERFLEKIPLKAHILDFGCGSGRDTRYFMERGYQVTPVDGSKELCQKAECYTGVPVRHMLFQELEEQETYDGIWACASILHLSGQELLEVMPRMAAALKEKGIVYTSFKYGNFEGMRNGRYFLDMTEEKWTEMVQKTGAFKLEEYWITSDVRPGRGEERWLNIILRKK
ncbi:MAG: class I SAM-dependent methyltransferase [Lachnospiraceae bacterium]|nr:class I SAM-dependent methyltransferase [Lachnospiraceae bacterium]